MFAESPIVLGRGEEVMLLLGGLMFAGVVIFVVHSIRKALETRHREQTKREIAAYVAEGSIAPHDAAMLLNAGGTDAERNIASGVAWGNIKPEKAEKLFRSLRQDASRPPAASAHSA